MMGEAQGEVGEAWLTPRPLRVGENLGLGMIQTSSRSTAAGALIQKQNAERVQIWNTEREEGARSSCPAAVD